MSSLWFLYGFTWVAQLSREQGGDVILIDCLIFLCVQTCQLLCNGYPIWKMRQIVHDHVTSVSVNFE